MTAMSPEEYVKEIYRCILQREPDSGGFQAFVDLFRSSNDATVVLSAMIASQEYRSKSSPDAVAETYISECIAELPNSEFTIVDVGAQTLSFEGHIYSPLIRTDIPYRIFGFEPLTEKIEERKSAEAGINVTLIPNAIADGNAHTLYINNDDATSSLFPLNRSLIGKFEHLHTLRLAQKKQVLTHTIDELLANQDINFLKLDIQGAEMLALKGAEQSLARTDVIHCEVEFSPIYSGQALFPEVQLFLNAHNFSLIDIIVPHRYAYLNSLGATGRDRLLWGDAIFFRETNETTVLASQALIAALVYKKPSLTMFLIEKMRSQKI